MPAAQDRGPMCRMDGSAAVEQASSIRRPTSQSVRAPRRYRPSRSEDDGNYSRPAERGCGDKARSGRGRHLGVHATVRGQRWNLAALNFSWASQNLRRNAAVPGAGNLHIRHLRHTVLTLRELLVAVQQVGMDGAYLPGYHFMTPEC